MLLSEIAHRLEVLLYGHPETRDTRYRCGTVSWILNREGWLTPVWTHLVNYDHDTKLVRFCNNAVVKLPRSQWIHSLPRVATYELTAHVDEISDALLGEIIAHSIQARTRPDAKLTPIPRFSCEGGYGHYAWTQVARDYYKAEPKR